MDDDDFGALAKLPCYGEWSFEKLEQFMATPEQTIGWLQGATAALIEATDQGAADRQIAFCEMKKLVEKQEAAELPPTDTNSFWEKQRQDDRRHRIASRIEYLRARLKKHGG